MPEKTSDSTPRVVEDGSIKNLGTEEDNNSRTASPILRIPPTACPPPIIAPPSHTPHRRSPEPARVSGARPTKQLCTDFETFHPGPSQASIPPATSAGNSPIKNAKRSISATTRQEKHKSHSPRLPSSCQVSARDLEKASLGQQSSYSHNSNFSNAHHIITVYTEHDELEEDEDPKKHAMWILIYLSALAPVLSLATCVYALLAAILILTLSPLCLCVAASPIRTNFRHFLVPPLNLQLGLIYSNFDDEESSSSSTPAMLILINVLAPIYAVGICMAAWVAAGFWFFTAILGDPNVKSKTEKDKDNDGKATVMSVRRWWERWLIRGLR